jgi:hypothetical protein
MPQSVSELRPYKSLLLGKVRDGVPLAPLVNNVLNEVAGLVNAGPSYAFQRKQGARATGELVAGFIHYIEDRPVTWTTDETVIDRVHQLVLVCRRKHHIAIYASDNRFRASLANRFDDPEAKSGLGAIESIPSGELNAAFVQGPTLTLWLAGTHRRTTVKADSKILSGLNLRDALDPLDDQTYYFSAARSLVGRTPVGVTPRRSSLWAGVTREWQDFRETVELLLRQLETVTQPQLTPLPVLAVAAIGASAVDGAFDVSLQPPELLADDPTIDQDTRAELERWGLRSSLEILDVDGADFQARIYLDGEALGTLHFKVDLSNPQKVRWEVAGEATSTATAERHGDALHHCRSIHWVKIRYDSGHTISDGAVFQVRFRDAQFPNFVWTDLTGFDPGREKPHPLSDIGNQRSLFDWIQRFWPNHDQSQTLPGGWLACDDGTMEIADFIHLDVEGNPPSLSLIHVKGAYASSQRQISVSAYEVVVGQAVKNLRYLDRLALEEGLAAGIGRMVGRLIWHDRDRTTRQEMIRALQDIGTNYQRHVVVFQPHVTRTRHDSARATASGTELMRLRQLDTLLLGADADAHALGARFSVLADGA